jgi:hypothetical protein
MLERLEFKHLGPGPAMALRLGERLNLLTGDNGLGKTFVLDAAWWALTRTWPEGRALRPDPNDPGKPAIGYQVHGITGANEFRWCEFDYHADPPEWKLPNRRLPIPGLILYARVDGGFSIWDPARNYWRQDSAAPLTTPQRPSAFQFNREQIWKGLWRTPKDEYEKNRDAVICRGLIEDIVSWQLDPTEKEAADLFRKVLSEISPDRERPFQLGPLGELLGWPGKLPTLIMPDADRPVLFEFVSSGVRRMLALAYALVWAWVEHQRALRLTKNTATEAHRVVLLVDEIETHLHPRWQRRILPALLEAVKLLAGSNRPVQLVITTHAPLVLASVETHFNSMSDRLFNFAQQGAGCVEVEEVTWAKFGDASGWLTSPVFDLDSGYSREAETAMKAADDLMAGYLKELPENLRTAGQIHAELKRTLDGGDPYWPLWLPYYRRQPRDV